MAVTSGEIAELIELARKNRALMIPFHNRRWDSDFRTLQKLLREQSVGRVVHLESAFDRWSPGATRRPWKNDPAEGGLLLDLGTHLADQALELFGRPHAVSAYLTRERHGAGASDSFTVRLIYDKFAVTLSANALSSLARPRFHLRGTHGNYWKWGLDTQEAALNKITRIADHNWGQEPNENWGTLKVDVDGSMVTCPIPALAGDYRLFYGGVRDALLGKSPAPISALAAWRVARLLEYATESASQHREIDCDWSTEPGKQ